MCARTLTWAVALPLLCAPAARPGLRDLFDDAGRPRAGTSQIRSALRSWIAAVIRQHGYSPGSPTLTSKLQVELSAMLPRAAECEGESPKAGCLGTVRVIDLDRPYLIAIAAGISGGCDYGESAYVFEWSRSRWHLRTAMEASPFHPGGYRRFHAFRGSPASATGSERVLAAVAFSGECRSGSLDTEMWVYRFNEQQSVNLVAEKRFGVADESDIQMSANLDAVQFDLPVQSLDPALEIRSAVHTFDLRQAAGAGRVEPVARSIQGFVEEWLKRPWSEASQWSAGGQTRLADAHRRLMADESRGEFLPTVGCGPPRTFEAAIRNLDMKVGTAMKRLPAAYFKVEITGDNRYRMLDVAAEPDPDCPRWVESQ